MIIFIALFNSGCSWDAERENPLDPHSPYYSPSSGLAGRITNLSNIPRGISDVILTLDPGNISTLTDSNGYYSFSNIEPDNYSLNMYRPDLKSIDTTISIQPEIVDTLEFSMNFIPQVDTFSVTTLRIADGSSGDYQILFYCVVSDSDGAATLSDSADIYLKDDLYRIEYNDDIGNYSKLFIHSLNVSDIEIDDYTNEGVHFKTNDINNDTTVSEIKYIIRFITEGAAVFSPSFTEPPTSKKPQFVWFTSSSTFTLLYKLKLYTLPSEIIILEETLYDTSQAYIELPNGKAGYNYKSNSPNDSLAIGTYMWTMQFEDIIGNISRSEEVQFTID